MRPGAVGECARAVIVLRIAWVERKAVGVQREGSPVGSSRCDASERVREPFRHDLPARAARGVAVHAAGGEEHALLRIEFPVVETREVLLDVVVVLVREQEAIARSVEDVRWRAIAIDLAEILDSKEVAGPVGGVVRRVAEIRIAQARPVRGDLETESVLSPLVVHSLREVVDGGWTRIHQGGGQQRVVELLQLAHVVEGLQLGLVSGCDGLLLRRIPIDVLARECVGIPRHRRYILVAVGQHAQLLLAQPQLLGPVGIAAARCVAEVLVGPRRSEGDSLRGQRVVVADDESVIVARRRVVDIPGVGVWIGAVLVRCVRRAVEEVGLVGTDGEGRDLFAPR